jgi:hypothetical protein
MSLPWSKPPDTITCPVCRTKVRVRWNKNSQFQLKPFCDSCGWNVTRARRHFLAYLWQIVMYAPLVAVFAWAMSGIMWVALLMAGWMLIIMATPIITNLRRLPPSRPAPPLPPLAGIADVDTVTLEVMRPRLNVILEGLVVIASGIAIVFLPRELDPARRRLPGVRHELLLVALSTVFAAYQLGLHGAMFFRLVRSLWLERHLAKRAMTGKGRIVESKSGTIKYEFLDYASQLLRGAGRDYSLGLYEDMPLSVLYDPDEPSLNMPAVGLQFHRQRGAP